MINIKEYTREQIGRVKRRIEMDFKRSGDSSWFEGWIYGYTDPDHGMENAYIVSAELHEFFDKLRSEKGR